MLAEEAQGEEPHAKATVAKCRIGNGGNGPRVSNHLKPTCFTIHSYTLCIYSPNEKRIQVISTICSLWREFAISWSLSHTSIFFRLTGMTIVGLLTRQKLGDAAHPVFRFSLDTTS